MKKRLILKNKLIIITCCLLAIILSLVASNISALADFSEEQLKMTNSEIIYNEFGNERKIKAGELLNANCKGRIDLDGNEEDLINNVKISTKQFEEAFSELNTNIPLELERTIQRYNELLENSKSLDEIEKIQHLIKITTQLKNNYVINSQDENIEEFNAKNYNSNRVEITLPNIISIVSLTNYVTAVISAFNLLGFNLAAELTTIAMSDLYINNEYRPVYGSHVLSSQVTYELAKGTATNSSAEFSDTDLYNTYEKDIYFSLSRFNNTKTSASSKKISILDTYDYNEDKDRLPEDTGIQGFAYEYMYMAQQFNIIYPTKVKIDVDTSECVRIQIIDKVNSTWKIAVTNYKDKSIDVFYNSKMCNYNDARNWLNLKDIKMLNVSANTTKIVEVNENYAATHFAFCHIDGKLRYITYANETYLSSQHSLNLDFLVCSYKDYGDLTILGNNSGTWLIRITNPYQSASVIQYNAKMCFEGDAKNWTNLADLKTFTLASGDSKIVEIQENAFATHIAVRIKGSLLERIIYANQLSLGGIMNVQRIETPRYLLVSNSGKSGSAWKINITNPLSKSITVYYNKKMCNFGDAQNWTGLKDISSFILAAGQTRQVTISTNFFATSIAICYFNEGHRLITYANGLNVNGGIKIMTNYIA